MEGVGDKKIYVWVEAVLGYLSAGKKWAEARVLDWKDWWNLPIKPSIQELYGVVGKLIEQGNCKEALESIFSFIRSSNKYFDEEQP